MVIGMSEKKRTTLRIEQATYNLAKLQKQKKKQSMQAYINEICHDIIAGKYDDFIEHEKTQSIAVYKEEFKQVKQYLKKANSSNSVTEIIEKVIISRG